MRSATKKKLGKNQKYLAFIKTLPCMCCCILTFGDEWLEKLFAPHMRGPHPIAVEAAHVGERGLSQKCSDEETAPLCNAHRTGGPRAHHRLGKKFWSHWGIDRDVLIAQLQGRFKQEK